MLAKCGEEQKTIQDKPDKALLTKLRDACENYDIDEIDAVMAEIENYKYKSDDGLAALLRENVDQGKYSNIKEMLSTFLVEV